MKRFIIDRLSSQETNAGIILTVTLYSEGGWKVTLERRYSCREQFRALWLKLEQHYLLGDWIEA